MRYSSIRVIFFKYQIIFFKYPVFIYEETDKELKYIKSGEVLVIYLMKLCIIRNTCLLEIKDENTHVECI